MRPTTHTPRTPRARHPGPEEHPSRAPSAAPSPESPGAAPRPRKPLTCPSFALCHLPGARPPPLPPLTSHLRTTPKPAAAIFEQGPPPGPVALGAVSRRRGPSRPPSWPTPPCLCGARPPLPTQDRGAAIFVRGAAAPRGVGVWGGEEARLGEQEDSSHQLPEKAADRRAASPLRHRQRRSLPSQRDPALPQDGGAGFAPLQDGGGTAPPPGGRAGRRRRRRPVSPVSLRRAAAGAGRGAMLAFVTRAVVSASRAPRGHRVVVVGCLQPVRDAAGRGGCRPGRATGPRGKGLAVTGWPRGLSPCRAGGTRPPAIPGPR